MSNTTYNCLWIGKSFSYVERLVILCNLRHLPPESVNLYIYDDLTDEKMFERLVSHGLNLKDANTVVPRSEVFMNPDRPSYAAFSNLFRYKLLRDEVSRQNISYWFDSDYILMGEPSFDSIYLGYESKRIINGAIFGVSPNKNPHVVGKFLTRLLQVGESRIHLASNWGSLGPRLISEVLMSEFPELLNEVRRPELLYPIPYRDTFKLFTPREFESVLEKVHQSEGLHLWNEAYRGLEPSPRDLRPQFGSYIAHLVQDYDPEVVFANTSEGVVSDQSIDSLRRKVRPSLSRRISSKIRFSGL